MSNRFNKFFGLGQQPGTKPIVLAPLAGVSDFPFRQICSHYGADLTYVEMLSATALSYNSERTLDMLFRHPLEARLGVQVTARNPEEMAKATQVLERYAFDTLDINMGCPVQKVVKAGCGSAVIKDPELVYKITKAARDATARPLSVKFRLGWDHNSKNYLEVGAAIADAGADWMTIHGRTRSDDYSQKVDLTAIAELKQKSRLPVIGNGNLFAGKDVATMDSSCQVDGFMVSRGALGNPWVFLQMKGRQQQLTPDEWYWGVCQHIQWQKEIYGNSGTGAICMRKHYLWYVKGWPQARNVRKQLSAVTTLEEAETLLSEFFQTLKNDGVQQRPICLDVPETQGQGTFPAGKENRSEETPAPAQWDPKWEMDRQLDRGVGHEGL